LYAIISERRRDLALFRALGGNRFQLGSIVLLKASFLGILGIVGGVISGLAVGWILVKIVNLQSFRWTLQMVYPWESILQLAFSILLFSLIVGLLPSWKTMKMNIEEALRENE
jgi:putative ABC transport system permease protein